MFVKLLTLFKCVIQKHLNKYLKNYIYAYSLTVSIYDYVNSLASHKHQAILFLLVRTQFSSFFIVARFPVYINFKLT